MEDFNDKPTEVGELLTAQTDAGAASEDSGNFFGKYRDVVADDAQLETVELATADAVPPAIKPVESAQTEGPREPAQPDHKPTAKEDTQPVFDEFGLFDLDAADATKPSGVESKESILHTVDDRHRADLDKPTASGDASGEQSLRQVEAPEPNEPESAGGGDDGHDNPPADTLIATPDPEDNNGDSNVENLGSQDTKMGESDSDTPKAPDSSDVWNLELETKQDDNFTLEQIDLDPALPRSQNEISESANPEFADPERREIALRDLAERQADLIARLQEQVRFRVAQVGDLRRQRNERSAEIVDMDRKLTVARDIADERDSRLEETAEQLEESKVDSLTGLLRMEAWEETVVDLLGQMRRSGDKSKSIAFAITDLDKFKEVNDRWGHPIGNVILSEAGKAALEAAPRDDDVVGRFGGEEQVFAMFNTDANGALIVLNRFKEKVNQSKFGRFEDGQDEKVLINGKPYQGISIGFIVIEVTPDMEPSQIVAHALRESDRALYWAKNNGRDQIVNVADIPANYTDPSAPKIGPASLESGQIAPEEPSDPSSTS